MIGRLTAVTSGQYDGAGRCTFASWTGWQTSSVAATRTRRPSSVSPYLRYQNSSRWVTVGTGSKLYSGVGDGIIHSIVRASHGSGPGFGRSRDLRYDQKMLKRKNATLAASVNAPTVATLFHTSNP